MIKNRAESPQPNNYKKHVKKALTAFTMVAALAPAVPAEARPHKAGKQEKIEYQSLRALERQTIARIEARQPNVFHSANLYTKKRIQDSETHKWRTVEQPTVHPIVVFRGNPKDQFGHNDLTSKDYAYGAVLNKGGHPVVHLEVYDPKKMELRMTAPSESETFSAILGGGPGSFEFNQGNYPNEVGGNVVLSANRTPALLAYQIPLKR